MAVASRQPLCSLCGPYEWGERARQESWTSESEASYCEVPERLRSSDSGQEGWDPNGECPKFTRKVQGAREANTYLSHISSQ